MLGGLLLGNILIVEEEPLITRALTFALADWGYSAAVAVTMEHGLALAKQGSFAAAVLEPGRSAEGLLVADVLRERNIPFCLTVGGLVEVPPAYRREAILNKPYRLDDLADLLEKLLQGAASYAD